jgi:hypothetical protein
LTTSILYLLFNVPGTPQFQASDSLAVTFDPLYFANKEASPDLLVSLIVAKREIWLLGSKTTEVWYNTGAPDFPFQSMPGVFIDRGCCAPYSVAETDNAVYWLSQDRYGQGIVIEGAGYQATRVSTYAIEAALSTYPTLADAVGYTYQLAGHVYYVLNFPAADKSWAYDITTKLWHELVWLDTNGAEHRHRANCATAAYGVVACGDWSNGNLYALDPKVFTDVGKPVARLRSFPHMVADGKRVFYRQLLADLAMGNGPTPATVPDPMIYLSWSDDGGRTFGNPVGQSMGALGEYLTSVQFQRLGMGRRRVFQLEWSTPCDTALMGAWIDAKPAQS